MPAFLFVDAFEGVLPAAVGFAAGAMVWMVARELLPEALAQTSARAVAGTAIASFAAMIAFQAILLATISRVLMRDLARRAASTRAPWGMA